MGNSHNQQTATKACIIKDTQSQLDDFDVITSKVQFLSRFSSDPLVLKSCLTLTGAPDYAFFFCNNYQALSFLCINNTSSKETWKRNKNHDSHCIPSEEIMQTILRLWTSMIIMASIIIIRPDRIARANFDSLTVPIDAGTLPKSGRL